MLSTNLTQNTDAYRLLKYLFGGKFAKSSIIRVYYLIMLKFDRHALMHFGSCYSCN